MCAVTKKLIAECASHGNTCVHRRTLPPGQRFHQGRNPCPNCRLNEALKSSEGLHDIVQRATLAAQLTSPVKSFGDLNFDTMHPITIAGWCKFHYSFCTSNPRGNCLLCKKLKDIAIEALGQKLQDKMDKEPNFLKRLLSDSQGAASCSNAAAASADDDVQIVGSSTREERNQRGFANAVDVEEPPSTANQSNQTGASASASKKTKKRKAPPSQVRTYNLRSRRN